MTTYWASAAICMDRPRRAAQAKRHGGRPERELSLGLGNDVETRREWPLIT